MAARWLLVLSAFAACGDNDVAIDPLMPPDASSVAAARWHCELSPAEPIIQAGIYPSVSRGPDGYTMWYGGFSAATSYLYVTRSPDGIHWEPAVRDQSRDGFGFQVVRAGPDDWRAYYSPVFFPAGAEQLQVWTAHSVDGRSWDAPVLALESGHTSSALFHDGQFWLFVTRGKAIYVATSHDGVSFVEHPEPVLEAVDELAVRNAGVVRYGHRFVMFYQAPQSAFRTTIKVATSEDGLHWERDPEPVLVPEGDGWIRYAVTDPEPLVEDGGITLWFDGLGPDGFATIGRARCVDR